MGSVRERIKELNSKQTQQKRIIHAPDMGMEPIAITHVCGHPGTIKYIPKDKYQDKRKAKHEAKLCQACRVVANDKISVEQKAAREKKIKERAEKGIPPTHFRLPDTSTIVGAYQAIDENNGKWTISLSTPDGMLTEEGGSIHHVIMNLGRKWWAAAHKPKEA